MLWSYRKGSIKSSMDVNWEKIIVLTESSSTFVLRISRTRRILEELMRPVPSVLDLNVLRFVSQPSQRSWPVEILD